MIITGLRDDIWNAVSSLFSGSKVPREDQTFLDQFFDIAYPIMVIAFFGFLAYSAWRLVNRFFKYAGYGEELGTWKIHVMGRSMVKGHLNVHEYVSDEDIKLCCEIKEIKDGAEGFKKLLDNQELFLYDFRIVDWDEAFDIKGGRDAIVMSAVPIHSEKYFWWDHKGDRSWFSPIRSKSKNVFAFITSNYIPDQADPYGDLKDVYDLVPIPKDLTVKMVGVDNVFQAVLELKKIEHPEAIIKWAEYLKTIAETQKQIEPQDKEIARLRAKVLELMNELAKVHGVREDERHLAVPHPYIGKKDLPKEFGKSGILGLMLFALIMGAFGYGLPDLIPALKGTIHPFLGVGIMAIMMFLIVHTYYEKKPQAEKEKIEV